MTVTVAEVALATTAAGVPGVPGVARGVTDVDAVEGDEVPEVFVAAEVKVYAVPLVRPVTVHEPDEPVTVQVLPPGAAVTVKDAAGPPLPGETVTTAWPFPAVALGAPGVPGGATGVTEVDAVDEDDVAVALVAVEVNVYAVLLVRPVIVQEPPGPVTVQVAPPGEEVTVYDAGAPPEEGALTVTVAWPLPGVADGVPGVPGAASDAVGVTEPEAADAALVALLAFRATDVKLYPVPLVRPVTVHEPDEPVTVQVLPPGEAVTVYEDTGPPEEGGVTVTAAEFTPARAVGEPGVPGGTRGVAVLEAADAADVPPRLVAVLVKVYPVPLVRPVMVHDPDAPDTVQVEPPGDAVTVYETAAPPPEGGVTVIVACPLPAATVGVPGVPGGNGSGVMALDRDEADVVPVRLLAVVLKR